MNEYLNNVEQICKRAGYTMNQACKAIGFSASTWYTWKSRDITPHLPFIAALCKFFRVSSDEVLFGLGKSFSDSADDKMQILARHIEEMPPEDRETIYNHFSETIEIYMARK